MFRRIVRETENLYGKRLTPFLPQYFLLTNMYNTNNTFVNKIWTDLQLSVQKRMCKAHSRAERGRLRQTTSLRECASSARSAFFVIGNSIGFSYYKKRLPCEWHRTAVSSVVLIKLLYICCKFSQKTFRTMHRTHYEKPGKIQPPEVLRS